MAYNLNDTPHQAALQPGTTTPQQRLLSLDILRGIDMALLVLIQPVIFSWLAVAQPADGTLGGFLFAQLEHVPWEGFCFWDIIMPLFMFMSGVSIPFAMSRYKSGRTPVDARFYRRVAKRLAILWLLGMFCQGNLMDFDLHTLKPFSNTLQSIAVGYVACTLLYVLASARVQAAVVAALFAAFIGVFAVWGDMDFSIGTNICQRIDNAVLGSMRDGVTWHGGTWAFDPEYNYTWLLSSLNFVVTVYIGCIAGTVLRSDRSGNAKTVRLLAGGAAMIAAGLAMSPWIPIIKHIWSSSMTLLSGGICLVFMAAAYYVVDVRHCTRGTGWLCVYGVNSLAAYVLAHISLTSVTDCFFHGFAQWLGDYYAVLQTAVGGTAVYIVLRWMRRNGIYLKA